MKVPGDDFMFRDRLNTQRIWVRVGFVFQELASNRGATVLTKYLHVSLTKLGGIYLNIHTHLQRPTKIPFIHDLGIATLASYIATKE